ncbi:HAMP domain-containing histidine kinase [Neobacillus drentensis]|uniref:sensor histidine kinase n=1 Tax=Neobacillus drentensis TaxID=220684 RepID=UPI001F48AB76|nr:HAMP domain-containing sensor histidine kinase [Neobacillus drentensis]ULT58983.1 HAMP domain-containing histidine kinase [Neobacillus drentensis]
MIESLLLNFLFLLFPVLLFLIFFENKLHTYNKNILILLSSISMVLCMAFPIKLEIGFIFDLRFVPFIIVALFGGYKYTIPLYMVLNIYRTMIGGAGILQSFLFSTIIFMLVPLLSKWFLRQNARKRILWAVLVSIFTMVFYLTSLAAQLPVLDNEFWILTFNALPTYTLVMVIIMILIEKIIDNINTLKSSIQSERFNVLSDLSASVSHEIRNPLTVTNGFLQLLNQSKTLTADEKTYIEYALLELKRAENIVSDFLAFAKPQSENMIYSNLKEETEYVKNIITPYANMHQVDLHYTFTNSLSFKYDKNQIQQCLINLYKNGIEAMKEKGGVLTIDVSEQKKDIVIKIEDNGVGMTKEQVLQLGNPYYSTKKEGTGLGMLMVYSTINKINGKILVDSEIGRGTSFIISIPV